MPGLASSASSISIAEIRGLVRGRVIAPGADGYDAARTVFYGGIDRHPAVIVKAADADDVSRVVSFARDKGLELAVRSGGHSTAGHSVTEGGIVLDLGDMKALQIDAAARTAWTEPGLTAGEYTLATHAHGLATGFGDTGSVGIGGLTLGGGVGYLVRKYGLTIDDCWPPRSSRPTARQLHLDRDRRTPDLFWAIRGGGGNFGVVNTLQVPPARDCRTSTAECWCCPPRPKVIAAFVAAAQAAAGGALGHRQHHARAAHAVPGQRAPWQDDRAGDAWSTPARAQQRRRPWLHSALLAAPLADMLKPMPYPEIYPPEEAGYHPMGAGRNMFVDHVDEIGGRPDPRSPAPFHGVFRGHSDCACWAGPWPAFPVDATAFAHRKSPIMLHVASLYEKPEERAQHEAWAEESMTALRQADTGAYVNFVGDEGPARVRAAYPSPTWERLVDIKRKYDPANLFRLNQNIPPA